MPRPVRLVMIIMGTLAVLTGVLWIGQGLGLFPGSFMTGDRTWFYVGILVLTVGAGLLLASLRRRRAG